MKKNLKPFLSDFRLDENSKSTYKSKVNINNLIIDSYQNEFWTASQHSNSSLHEISYRACFKANLPHFFIENLTKANDTVYDPFAGRGTTAIEAGLMNRQVISNDINPLSLILTKSRFFIPDLTKLKNRLEYILSNITKTDDSKIDLSMFYEKETLNEIYTVKTYLNHKRQSGNLDNIDNWIAMVTTSRLSGHSQGFLSVYSLPPNQTITPERQKMINRRLNQKPEYKSLIESVLKKSRNLISSLDSDTIKRLERIGNQAIFTTNSASSTPEIPNNTIDLVITSPPFLDTINYMSDNWLRCWFNSIDQKEINISVIRSINKWSEYIKLVFLEIYRVTKYGGYVAFEVGEIKNGSIKLEEYAIPMAIAAGFKCEAIIINQQNFTKTSNIWGITNNKAGTNTNRIILLHKI